MGGYFGEVHGAQKMYQSQTRGLSLLLKPHNLCGVMVGPETASVSTFTTLH